MKIEITDEQLLFIYRFAVRSKLFLDRNLDPLNRAGFDNVRLESLKNLTENLKNHVDKLDEHKKNK